MTIHTPAEFYKQDLTWAVDSCNETGKKRTKLFSLKDRDTVAGFSDVYGRGRVGGCLAGAATAINLLRALA